MRRTDRDALYNEVSDWAVDDLDLSIGLGEFSLKGNRASTLGSARADGSVATAEHVTSNVAKPVRHVPQETPLGEQVAGNRKNCHRHQGDEHGTDQLSHEKRLSKPLPHDWNLGPHMKSSGPHDRATRILL